MKPIQKILFAGYLLDEAIEDVLANIGSPPFPLLDNVQKIRDELLVWEQDMYKGFEDLMTNSKGDNQ